MTEEILYLEPDEEITRIIDRLRESKAKNLLLVIPQGAIVLQSLVNLKLLVRKAAEFEKEIAVVTQDRIGRNLASQAGLTVYRDAREHLREAPPSRAAEAPAGLTVRSYYRKEKPEEEPAPPKPPEAPRPRRFPGIPLPALPKVTLPRLTLPALDRRAILLALPVAVFFFLFLFAAKAEVRLHLRSEPFEKILELSVVAGAPSSFEDKRLAGIPLSLEREEKRRVKASGKKNVGQPASGTIIIQNSWTSDPLPLVPETRFVAEGGKTFKLATSAIVPGAKVALKEGVFQVTEPGRAQARIVAIEPGEEYNIPPSRFKIPGLPPDKQDRVIAESAQPLSGGTTKIVAVVSEEDVNRAREELRGEIGDRIRQEFRKQAGRGQRILEGAVKEEIITADAQPPAGSEAADFEMKVRLRARTLAVSEAEFRQLFEHVLTEAVPADFNLRLRADDPIEVLLIDFAPDGVRARIQAKIRTNLVPKIATERLATEVAGRSGEEAKRFLESFREIERVEIRLPLGSRRVPHPARLKMTIIE